MFKKSTSNLLLFFLLFIFYIYINNSFAIGATFYIDYNSGSDSNNGISTSAPWKHCPGDPSASGNPKSTILRPGDKVYFKGGVNYRGKVLINGSGLPENPIILTTATDWGAGKGIIDGTDPIAFTACPNKEICDNDNWMNMYYATLPAGANKTTPLFENGSWLYFAQKPEQYDKFFYTDAEGFKSLLTAISTTQCTDPSFFTQNDPNYWVGAYFMAHVTGNALEEGKITSYNPETSTVTYNALNRSPDAAGIDLDNSYHYTVYNHIHLIDDPGEYAIDESSGRIFLWPNSNASNITISCRDFGIHLNSRSYITIDSLIFDGHWAATYTAGKGITANTGTSQEGITIQNCEIKNAELNGASGAIYSYNSGAITTPTYIKNNYIHHIRGRGITVVGKNFYVQNNTFRYLTGTAIYYAGVRDGEIEGNDIDCCKGTHSNGISIYQNSANVIVKNNKILNMNSYYGPYAITHEASRDLSFYNNIIDGKFYSWGPASDCNYLRMQNNIIMGSSYISNPTNCSEITWQNNICAGIDKNSMTIHTHNIYIKRFWNQSSNYGWTLGVGEFDETDLSKIFIDALSDNFQLSSTSAAIGKGIDLSNYFSIDIVGNPRPTGSGWTIGPYQNAEGNIQPPRALHFVLVN